MLFYNLICVSQHAHRGLYFVDETKGRRLVEILPVLMDIVACRGPKCVCVRKRERERESILPERL